MALFRVGAGAAPPLTEGQDKRRERAYFDAHAEHDGWAPYTSRSVERLMAEFVSQLPPGVCRRVLDVGCASGEQAQALHRALGLHYVGFDLSAGLVRRARSKLPAGRFVVADSETIPFVPGSFDGVLAGALLHHFADPRRILAEARRVLQPGGVLFAYDPNPQNPLVFFYRVVLGARAGKTENETLHWPRAIALMVEDGGFAAVSADMSLPIFMTRDYYAACLGPVLGSLAWAAGNGFLWLVARTPWLRRRCGAFVVTRARKPAGVEASWMEEVSR